MLFSVSSDEARIRCEWLEYEAKVIALHGKPAPPELEDQQFRLLTEAMDTYDVKKAASLYKKFVVNETYNCPTLVIHRAWGRFRIRRFSTIPRSVTFRRDKEQCEYLSGRPRSWSTERKAIAERLYQHRLRVVGEMNRAGVKLLAGTDTAYGYPVAGFALHDELALFVQAGLSPMEALQTATINAAKFFSRETEFGTVEKGKLADLILLDADPLADISNTKKIVAVVLNGRLFERTALEKVLLEVQAAANKNYAPSLSAYTRP